MCTSHEPDPKPPKGYAFNPIFDRRQIISRRRFMTRLAGIFATGLATGLLPPMVRGAIAAGDLPLHYRPLAGDNLKELARRKAHHGDGRFVCPMGIERKRKFGQLLTWKLFGDNAYQHLLGQQSPTPVAIDWQPVRDHTGVSVTWIKHASVLIKDGDRTLLVDPIFDDIFWFIDDYSPLAFDLESWPRIDHVLITHGHYDHLDKPSLARLDRQTHVISPLGYDSQFAAVGMDRRDPLDWYDTYSDGQREITFLPANHWTMRNPITGPNRSLWGGYLIRTAGGPVIYLSGDTAYFDGFDQFAADWDIDLAIFNLGAYAPRWFMAPSHMNPAETVQAFQQVGARRLMIAHWGAFQLGDEPVHLPPVELRRELARQGLLSRWVPLAPGETFYF